MTLPLNAGAGSGSRSPSREGGGGGGTSAWYEIHVHAKMVARQLRIIPNRVRQWWTSLQVGDVMSVKNEVLCRVYGITGEGVHLSGERNEQDGECSVYFLRLG